MREIVFRGKRIDTGEWVYGYLADEAYINDINTIDLSSIEVDPDTVGQYTGLKDKNGKEIWEHDLLETLGVLFEVVYSDHIGSFVMLDTNTQIAGTVSLRTMLDMFAFAHEGNIHDNQELLEGEK